MVRKVWLRVRGRRNRLILLLLLLRLRLLLLPLRFTACPRYSKAIWACHHRCGESVAVPLHGISRTPHRPRANRLRRCLAAVPIRSRTAAVRRCLRGRTGWQNRLKRAGRRRHEGGRGGGGVLLRRGLARQLRRSAARAAVRQPGLPL